MNEWNFTYGADHPQGLGSYTTVRGATDEQAREIQVALNGYNWCSSYATASEKWQQMVREHGLKCVQLVKIESIGE